MRKKITIRVLTGIGLAIILLLIFFIGIFFNEIRSLVSINRLNDHPFYTMRYYGDYGFDDFLMVGASNDKEIEDFVINRLLKGIDIDLGISSAACTAFSIINEKGDNIFARNFDFDYAPSLLLFTEPKNGYKSVSMVNLSYIGYHEDYLPKRFSISSFLTLAAPYLPFDGLNEKGVAMALLAVPFAEPPNDLEKVTLNTTTAIRLVLDKASTTEEAIQLLKNYNYYFSGDIYCSYLISDSTGDSVIIEFLENDVKVIRSLKEYQIASNFIQYDDLWIGDGYCEFERYEIANDFLSRRNGILTQDESMDLLKEISIPEKTQWSIIYNLDTLEIQISTNMDYFNQNTFSID